MCKYIRLLSAAILAACLLVFPVGNTPAFAAGSRCAWTGASPVSASWFEAGNWTCSAGSLPGPDSSVTISGGAKIPYLDQSATIQSLALSARLDFRNGAVLTTTAGWKACGGTLHGAGAISGQGTVTGGILNASVTFAGDLILQPGARLRVEPGDKTLVTVLGSVTNNGAIDSAGGEGTFSMQGPKFTNNGSVDRLLFYFQRDFSQDGEQHLAGTGTWGQGATIKISIKTNVILDNSMTFNVKWVDVDGDGWCFYGEDRLPCGGGLEIGPNILTLIGPVGLSVGDFGSVWADGGGSIHAYGPLNLLNERGGQFLTSVRFSKGADGAPNDSASTIFGSLGDVTIDAGVEVDVITGGEVWGTWVGNLWVYGALKGIAAQGECGVFIGGDVVVDGAVDLNWIQFGSNAPQKITGKSSIHTEDLAIYHPNGGDVTLAVPAKVDHSLVLEGDLIATGDGITLASGAATEGRYDLWGTVRREGPLAFGQQYGMGGRGLYLIFSPDGSTATPPGAVTMTMTKGAPPDFRSAVQRWYNFAVSGGTDWSATLHLPYRPDELGANVEVGLQLWGRSGTAPWNRIGGTQYTGLNNQNSFVEEAGMKNFSDIALASEMEMELFLPWVGK